MIEGPSDPFSRQKPLIGMIHLSPLPGAATYDGRAIRAIIEAAVTDAGALQDGGFDGILIQNSNDHPPVVRVPPATVAAYAAIASAVTQAVDIPLGINVLKSDAAATIGIAKAVDARFVRLKVYVGAEMGAEGLVQGCAAEAIRLRRDLLAERHLEIWADAVQPTGRPVVPISPVDAARWCVEFGHADRVVITGDDLVGSLAIIDEVRRYVSVPLILGGGVEPESAGLALSGSDGLIVGRYLRGGTLDRPVDRLRVAEFREAADASRRVATAPSS